LNVYLGEGGVGEFLERKLIFFTAVTIELTYKDSTGRDGGQAHTVPDEDDHVFGTILILLFRQDPVQCLLAGL